MWRWLLSQEFQRVTRFRRFGAILGMEDTGKKSWHSSRSTMALLALFCGFSTTILMAILFCFGILPSIDRGWAGVPFSAWCLPSGFVVTIVVMIFWRSPTKVFLDRICISQNDNDLKNSGNFQLGRFAEKFRRSCWFYGILLGLKLGSLSVCRLKFWWRLCFLLDTKGYVSTLILWHWKLKT